MLQGYFSHFFQTKKSFLALPLTLALGIGSIVLVFLCWSIYPLFLPEKIHPGHIIIRDRNGFIMTDIALEDGYALPLKLGDYEGVREIPFVRDMIKIEDKRFFEHNGIDAVAKVRAVWGNIFGDELTGGSTLVEQWIKNRYFLRSERSIMQKIREGFLAFLFSITHRREILLQKYLDTVYLGNNIYGVQTAMQTYFHKSDIRTLREVEIVTLITLIHNPGLGINDHKFQEYFNQVKERLGYIFDTQIDYLPKHENVDYFPFITRKAMNLCADEAKKDGVIFFQESDCERGDFKSTIDLALGLFARNTVRHALDGLSEKNVTNAAIFAINPLTYEVLIYEGSRDFNAQQIEGQVDVIQAIRQPGSTMKPFLYLMALERGIRPDDLVIDIQEQYPSFQPGETYTSENYTLKEYGLVRFKKALGNSLNNSSVRLAQFLGLKEVYDFYKSHGFQLDSPAEYYGYSLVLGNPSITLYDLVMSYIDLVPKPDADGDLDPSKFLLYDILRNPDNRDISFGVNSILNTSIPQAVKTGTSSNFRDNTLVSYSPDMVIGIWFGNNDNSPMIGVTGITGAGYTWHQIVEEMIQRGYITDRTLQVPEGLEQITYCFDRPCFRQEKTYQKIGTEYFSALADGIYDHRDIPEAPTADDIQKLEDLGIRIQ